MMKAKKNFVNVLSTGILSIVGRKLNLEKHDLHVTTMRKKMLRIREIGILV